MLLSYATVIEHYSDLKTYVNNFLNLFLKNL